MGSKMVRAHDMLAGGTHPALAVFVSLPASIFKEDTWTWANLF